MGRRCWKKAVMCGASGVHALAGTSVPLSFAHICAAPLWDPLVAGRLPSERISCWLSRVFLEFSVIVSSPPWQIVLHGRQCLASDPARLPDTNTYGPPCCGQDKSIMPACVW